MSVVLTREPEASAQFTPRHLGRQRRAERDTGRVRRDGKFFRLNADKFFVKGATYGPFAPNRAGEPFPERAQARADFEQLLDLGANCIRIYDIPPKWFMDLAQQAGLRLFVDVSWPKNLEFIRDQQMADQARRAVREAAAKCGNHPAIFAISVVNEVPPDLVRFSGRGPIEDFIDELVDIGKQEAPDCLFTFANFPTTEYLRPRNIDFVCFNVYLHDEPAFRNYIARLQNIAGELPLLLGEYGIDTMRENTEDGQAEVLGRQLSAIFDEGAVGTFVFSFTDDWYVHGWQIDDWAFGLVRRDRTPKPAFEVVKEVFRRAPQTSDIKLPMASIVICSYNGASTVESCLRSMQKIRYPGEYEVVFVDDGSTDNTQEILKQFPWVRNIRQKNMGLSYARNVGMEAAKGEIVVYTDSDCEADEDWLYYLALALKRGGYVGMGGPNLIPDEGSWVADCVGLSPGGPTHVMIDDREAEHVPGCNMAFYKWALRQINGFDSQFRKAGDDVDVIWRLQGLDYPIGFAPAAQVWHYRRNTVKAYLKQQRGYGEAEAMLKFKHPDHFNTLGASHWRGKIYGADSVGIRIGGDVIYHGLFGTGLFQTIYRRPASILVMMLMSIEWHLLAVFMTVVGLAFSPLLWVALLMFLTPIALSCVAAVQAPAPKHRHWLSRPLVALLHYRQPMVRGWARYSVRLKAKVLNRQARGYRRKAPLPYDPFDRNSLRYWSKTEDRFPLLARIREQVKTSGWRYRLDSGWNNWDMEIYGSRYVKLRITTATETHDNIGKLTRVRVEAIMSNFCRALLAASTILAVVLLLDMWPFSRTAILLPLAWWSMYAVNRWRVSIPVLGLIDESAEKAGFYPVPTRTPPKDESGTKKNRPHLRRRNRSGPRCSTPNPPSPPAPPPRPCDRLLDLRTSSYPLSLRERAGVRGNYERFWCSGKALLVTLTEAYKRAWCYYRHDSGNIVVSVILVGLTTLATLAQPFCFAILVDRVLRNKPANQFVYRLYDRIAPLGLARQVILLAAALLLFRLLGEGFGIAQGFFKIRIGYNGILRVRCDLFRHYQRLNLGFHKTRAQGDLIYRLSSDTNGFVAAFNVCHGILVNSITLLFMAWFMFAMDWRLALVAVSITPFLFMAIRKYGGVLTQTSIKATQIEAGLATTVHRSVATVGLVQAFGREDDEYDRFRADVARSSDGWVKMHMQGMIYWAILGVCFGVGTALILGVGGYLASRPNDPLEVGVLWVFFQYVTAQLYAPLQALSGSETELRRGLAGMMRVYEVLDIEPDIQDSPNAIPLERKPRVLQLVNVSFGYSPERTVLRDVSVTVRPGEMVAFVGSSGTGKTSLLNLLPRFYDPTAGKVTLDGHDFRDIRLRDLRSHVALVLQDSPILSASVFENLAYGNPSASEEVIRTAARMAGADSFIESLPQQYHTQLHEAGQNLSGGQRQRIGIARALATLAPILVLDEPTSALDAHNEQMITRTLRDLKGTRTIILVSHRLSTVAHCDRIYMMESGQVVEEGTHDQLLARKGPYAKMARHQVQMGQSPADEKVEAIS